ncbi:MAG: lipid-A-disaccharide synthase-related protein [Chroococcales cyanobacterium]
MKLLCLSNGHGEDEIAVRILEQLQHLPNAPELAAYPLVGEGYAYRQLNIPILGPVQKMPSGGFIYMDNRQLWRDIQGGLVKLTLAQYKVIRQWGKRGGAILAVGDLFPLLLAWLSGSPYAFVGTAKSEYYLRDETGWLRQTSRLERWYGSVYYPWERWLMTHSRCKAVFPRDSLTTEILQKFAVPAFNLGNPMMDGIKPEIPIPLFDSRNVEEEEKMRSLMITLLPGSRPPEAYDNWQVIGKAVSGVIRAFSDRSVLFLAAIAPSLKVQDLIDVLTAFGWHSVELEAIASPISDPEALAFKHQNGILLLTQNAYSDCLLNADFAIAMAGTATEQFVGLGKPAITLPGKGPQFTPAFAEAQTRLLGESVLFVQQPDQVANAIQFLLQNPDRFQLIAENGARRMGEAGAAKRIASCVMEKLL